ncbi:hypothetical protein B0H17DRAFT_1138433 [Mycena rosella]|uniref:Uncharacterized protein n=1 Tax=Mycena rosella TaxID=1033263 RepID=A0AAD7G9L8_MYCRO|nr:hypothetical protein B0H17DRAFT_1138433 [Mycena rosella]
MIRREVSGVQAERSRRQTEAVSARGNGADDWIGDVSTTGASSACIDTLVVDGPDTQVSAPIGDPVGTMGAKAGIWRVLAKKSAELGNIIHPIIVHKLAGCLAVEVFLVCRGTFEPFMGIGKHFGALQSASRGDWGGKKEGRKWSGLPRVPMCPNRFADAKIASAAFSNNTGTFDGMCRI